jgi:hypothetical protein
MRVKFFLPELVIFLIRLLGIWKWDSIEDEETAPFQWNSAKPEISEEYNLISHYIGLQIYEISKVNLDD